MDFIVHYRSCVRFGIGESGNIENRENLFFVGWYWQIRQFLEGFRGALRHDFPPKGTFGRVLSAGALRLVQLAATTNF